jgi:hypothetical protein
MKKSIKVICILLLANLSAIKVKAQVADSVSVLISPGTSDSKVIGDVRAAIKMQNGVRFIGYCSNHNVFAFYINPAIHGSAFDFYNNLKTTINVPTLSLKNGKVDKLLPFCSFSDPVDAALIKAK